MSAGGRLSSEEVRKVARLARLALTDAQIETYAGQMTQVLGYIERLRELNLEGVAPMANPSDAVNCLGADEPSGLPGAAGSDRLGPEALMRIAPETGRKTPPFVSVPKVIGEEGGA